MKHTKAFTLIELLIVVAIIGILAAIAVPNFLCSLVKAKVARAQADLKTVSTAIEMYRLDNNQVIMSLSEMQTAGKNTGSKGVWNQLSVPIEYLSSAAMQDPFKIEWYDEKNTAPDFVTFGIYGFNKSGKEIWRTYSIGPSQKYEIAPTVLYNVTNGCQSAGGIIRTNAGQL